MDLSSSSDDEEEEEEKAANEIAEVVNEQVKKSKRKRTKVI